MEIREDGDDRVLIIEYNRYRHKTASELMREAALIEAVIAEKALENKKHVGMPGKEALPEGERIATREVVSAAIGMKPRTFNKLKAVYEASKDNANAKEKLDRVDRGELSIDAAYKSIRVLTEDPADADSLEIPEFIRFFTSWQFSENDPRFGIPHPGRIPGQIPANVIYYFTEPGDLVVDPMAGGGSTIDAAELLDRECLGYDLAPRRPDITQWDISKGFPAEAKGCQLIFMDPPYWNMKDEGYVDGSSSRLSLDGFIQWYKSLLSSAAETIRVGGFVAVINMAQFFRLPADFAEGYIDWSFYGYEFLRSAGLKPWSRIVVTYPTSLYGGYDVESAKKGRFLLPNVGDIIVMRRMP